MQPSRPFHDDQDYHLQLRGAQSHAEMYAVDRGVESGRARGKPTRRRAMWIAGVVVLLAVVVGVGAGVGVAVNKARESGTQVAAVEGGVRDGGSSTVSAQAVAPAASTVSSAAGSSTNTLAASATALVSSAGPSRSATIVAPITTVRRAAVSSAAPAVSSSVIPPPPPAVTTTRPLPSPAAPPPAPAAQSFTARVISPALGPTERQPICVQPGMFALTFDDGPFMYTSELLDVLDRLGVKATFFLNGDNVQRNPPAPITGFEDVVKRTYAAGHQIASHTWSHNDITGMSEAQLTEEVTRLEEKLRSLIGVAPTFFRPPFGLYTAANVALLGRLGYRYVVLWNVDPRDWESAQNHPTDPALAISLNLASDTAQITLAPTAASYIHLSHDVWAPTVQGYTEQLVGWLRQRGYTRFVTVAECLGESAANAYKA